MLNPHSIEAVPLTLSELLVGVHNGCYVQPCVADVCPRHTL